MSASDPIVRLNSALEGRYRVERLLGEGGMADVYLAHDVRHQRRVALKVLKPELAAAVGVDRFLAEIRTTANLQHPHILPLFDSGEADGFLFYVMPYVEGESLRERLSRHHQLPVDEAVQIARNVAEALEHAHARGVVHRDIKPANILLQEGKPVVADFGIALAVGAAGGGRLTETGLSVGTPHYMSPEQATGDLNVGPATDIYSLGCVLYEMLIGEPPHTGSSPRAILGKILSGEPRSATEQRPSVPANVDAVIRRALESIPADRFAGARDFATALSRPEFRHGSTKEVRSRRPLAPASWVAALALVVLAAAMVAWGVRRPPVPPLVRTVVPLPADLDLEVAAGAAFAVSPDGSQIVFAGTTGGVTQLWHRPLSELAARPIPGTEGARTPTFSPDGTAIAYISTGRLMTVSLSGAPPVALIEGGLAGGSSGLAWSDDGWLYFRRSEEGILRRIRATGEGPEETITSNPGLDVGPDALPGGRGLLFTRIHTGEESEVVLVDLETRVERPLFEGRTARYAGGYLVYSSIEGVLLAVPFDARRLEVTGPPGALVQGVETTPISGSQFALARSGSLLYREGAAVSGLLLGEVDLEGRRTLLPLAPGDFTHVGPGWSPDGETVTYSRDTQIYTYNTRLRTTPRQITFEGLNISPVFSPDGGRLAFSTAREGTRGVDLFVKDLSDDSPPRSLLSMEGAQFVTQWPFDTLLVFESADDRGSSDLWMLDLSDPGRPEARLYLSSEADLSSPVVSPDGRLAAYVAEQSGTEELYVRSFPVPGEPTAVAAGGIPAWSAEGNTLYFGTRIGRQLVAARLQREPGLRVLSLDTVFGDPGLGQVPMPGSMLHPDGDRFIFALLGEDAAGGPDATGRLVLVQNVLQGLAGER